MTEEGAANPAATDERDPVAAAEAARPHLSDAALRDILLPFVNERHPGRTLAALDRHISPYSSSFTIENLDLHLDDGTTLRRIFKDLGPDALLADARRARPMFLYDPARELRTYEAVLPHCAPGTPAFFGAVCEPGGGRGRGTYFLFLERVESLRLAHVGQFDAWLSVAEWLAAFHVRCATRIEEFAAAAPLLRHDRAFYRLWLDRALENASAWDVERAWGLGRLQRLSGCYDGVLDKLTSLPATIIHGEFYPSNILLAGQRVCPVDWELAGVGPCVMDLATLTSGGWNEAQRAAMAAAYHAALCQSDNGLVEALPDVSIVLEAMEFCRLQLALQWVGWSTNWSPPMDQARDWLNEVVLAADQLGI